MTDYVIDASIAVKWVTGEEGSDAALHLLESARLLAPDLLISECANVLWKKVRRGEFSLDEAILAARILQRADVEISPTRHLLDAATRIAVELDHAAYDCVYLALALDRNCRFVSADRRFVDKVRDAEPTSYGGIVLLLEEAAGPA
ncbi:type II toxin-antitoxin system VapC family toxin [Microbaculum marinum]|uniref:Ribonuclease VapC n=1 Tax=Microbaculum marinum TaxID=1764581 RepID=A0AAW9RRT5_9HYPH